MRVKRCAAALAVGALLIAACGGGGGSSEWSKADQQHFRRDDIYYDTNCALQLAQERFNSYTDFVRAVGTAPDSDQTEAGKAYANEVLAKCKSAPPLAPVAPLTSN